MNKKVAYLFFMSLLLLSLVSVVNAADVQDDNITIVSSCNHIITSNLIIKHIW